jgi:hypothetical protein
MRSASVKKMHITSGTMPVSFHSGLVWASTVAKDATVAIEGLLALRRAAKLLRESEGS